MKSIYLKLFLSYFILMAVILAPFLYQFFTYSQTLSVYSDVIENLLLIEKIPINTKNLVNTYGLFYTNIKNEQLAQDYLELSDNLDQTFNALDSAITNEESRVLFRGLYNSSTAMRDSLDNGLEYSRNGNIEKSSQVYDQVIKNDSFSEDNTAKLLLKEIGALQIFQQKMESNIRFILFTSLVFSFVSIVAGISAAFYFSRIITSPVSVLSHLSANVSKGNFDIKVPKRLLSRKDEIGLLSRSLNEMFIRITSQIKTLELTQRSMTQQNEDLEKTNRLMINRELKMVELKKKIKQLQKS